ncbi:hypothetical protein SBOR_6629 [Sclerotinia borealis F-4128]|uniref:DUF952 domain protein n=1 Tax=Sclerotinia borealis (strain F-4128) TaxID=1432307 RepID=W9CAX7_SCLBF|nr:hypothetical protein SBOR_6629 [Sclerotinia borealis F-4128]
MSSTSESYPTYIYKILPSDAKPSSPLPEALPVSDLDQRDGFVHCSTSQQLLGTLNAFFSYVDPLYSQFLYSYNSTPSLDTISSNFPELTHIRNESHVYILRIKYEKVASYIKWENAVGKQPEEVGGCWDTEGKAGFFPHIYNGLKVGKDEVDDSEEWKQGNKGWSGEGWCWGKVDCPV